ncbi:MAG: transposase [Polyangiaceae bacterium]|nr:transposase [Polyangiaceae bacterium]
MGVSPIDNGIIERLHRRPAVGRRNYLFAGSHEGAKRAAIAYSLCATCNLLEIDPVAYLADVLLRSPEASPSLGIRALTPASWKDRKQA